MNRFIAIALGAGASLGLVLVTQSPTHAQGTGRPAGSAVGRQVTGPVNVLPPRRPTTWYYVPANRAATVSLTNISGKGGVSTGSNYGVSRFADSWRAQSDNWNNDGNYFKVDPPKVVILNWIIAKEKGDKPLDLEFGFHNAYLWDNEKDRANTQVFGQWRPLMWRNETAGVVGPITLTHGSSLFTMGTVPNTHQTLWRSTSETGTRGSRKTVFVAGAVHGVQTCLNGAETRIKGIRLFGSTLQPDGTFKRDPALQEEFTRPNCSKWQTAQRCAQGQVAVGVNVRYATDYSAVGLALQCMAVKRNELPEGYLDAPEAQRRLARPANIAP